ncbi:MAG TPA: hypothetical protein VFS63_09755 [Pseudolabrys sp.]|jgi:hypothetical protein|nr:hypothetical protein [Pseudolabrys sp.]
MAEATEAALAAQIERLLQQPVFFRDILAALRNHPYRAILRAWSDVRTRRALARDEFGRYWLEKG